MSNDSHRAIEAVARESYGRLIAFLASRTRDVASAEDALSDALLSALATWPRDGIPKSPQAWLLAAARNRLIDQSRHRKVQDHSAHTLELIATTESGSDDRDAIPDERLRLLFVCAHPAIDADMHTPLMLQSVLGLSAHRIARAFLTQPQTMSQRLVRVKNKIRKAGIAFDIPSHLELPQRLNAVLNAVYAAYGSGWEDAAGVDPTLRDLKQEAVWLARSLCELLPAEPEVHGLLALILHCDARQPARRRDGAYVPLTDQDTRLWSVPLMQQAESALTTAARLSRPDRLSFGRFQLEAAIQSIHAERAHSGSTNWQAIDTIYAQLVRLSPTLGALVAQAAAHAEVAGPQAALTMLDEIDATSVNPYQPYWAVRAHLLRELNLPAQDAFDRAIGLSEDDAVRRFLMSRRAS